RAQLERRIARLDEKRALLEQALKAEKDRVLNEEVPHA
ncbi:hypothetical protein LCGC14_2382310, partial [marine sediment metagenome]